MVRSGFTLKFFGFLRADVEADSRRMSLDLQFPIYLMSPADPSQMQKQTGDLTMHPRLTRFGFDVVSPNLANGWQPTAKMEMDFFNIMTDRPAPANPAVAPGPTSPMPATSRRRTPARATRLTTSPIATISATV